jgi:hypothetical protein
MRRMAIYGILRLAVETAVSHAASWDKFTRSTYSSRKRVFCTAPLSLTLQFHQTDGNRSASHARGRFMWMIKRGVEEAIWRSALCWIKFHQLTDTR